MDRIDIRLGVGHDGGGPACGDGLFWICRIHRVSIFFISRHDTEHGIAIEVISVIRIHVRPDIQLRIIWYEHLIVLLRGYEPMTFDADITDAFAERRICFYADSMIIEYCAGCFVELIVDRL